jgi:hypothetical protein
MKYLILVLAFWLAACGSDKPQSSSLHIINGTNVKIEPNDSKTHLPFLIGIELGRKPNDTRQIKTICSGFRYGLNKVITSARCIRKGLPFDSQQFVDKHYENEMLVNIKNLLIQDVRIISGAGFAGEGEVLAHFHNHFNEYCAAELKCPDIAVLELSESIAGTEHFAEMTDPALIGLNNSGNFKVNSAGFGCNSDKQLNVGYCDTVGAYDRDNDDRWSTNGFRSFSYSLWEDTLFYSATYFYENFLEKPWPGATYYNMGWGKHNKAFAAGDSGAPIFHESPSPVTYRAGDVARYTVEGIGLFTPEMNEKQNYGYNAQNNKHVDNFSLVLGHPKILPWLKAVLKEEVNLQPVVPAPQPTVSCAVPMLDPKFDKRRTELTAVPERFFNEYFDEALKQQLNDLKKLPVVAVSLAGCFHITFNKIAALEKAYAGKFKDETYESELARLEYMNFLHYLYLELSLEYQTADENQRKALMAARYDVLYMLGDLATDIAPGVSFVKDIISITTGINPVTGEPLSDAERAITL